ncbi:MAG TPA: hypothetical protein VFZ98_11535 [Vicinamibacterales bacterium]
MPTLPRVALFAVVVAAAARPAHAQDESVLRSFFEGKTVIVKMDLPGTQQGVDVYPDARRAVDMKQYSTRIKSYGVAIRNGESVLVTLVHVKDKLIEFQLAGGGFGTLGDDTNGDVYVAPVSKSDREKDLEKFVKNEDDPVRKRRLQRELDDLRDRREREDAANKAAAATASEVKKERIASERRHSGSRFNIRYDEGVPVGMGPDGVMRALADYVDFPFAADQGLAMMPPAGAQASIAQPPVPQSVTALQKGMSLADVERLLGKADKTSQRTEGSLTIVTNTFARGDQIISADFVEGVLVKYSISSR